MKKALYILIISLLTSCIYAQKQEEELRVDSILASVNGTPISLLDIVDETSKHESRMKMMFSGKELKKKIKAIRRNALEEAINRQLIVDDYYNDPFEIPRQHIEDMIDKLSFNFSDGTRKSLKRKIEETGISLDDLEGKAKDTIIVNYMMGNLFFKEDTVTPREVYAYYEKNKKRFSSSPGIRLQVLFIPGSNEKNKDLLKEVAADMKSGNEKIFKSLVMLHSTAPNSKSGGDLGWIEADKLRPEFVLAVKDKRKGYISEAVETPEGIYFIRIADRKPGGKQPFKEVSHMLMDELRNKNRDKVYNQYVKDLKRKAIIRYFIKK